MKSGWYVSWTESIRWLQQNFFLQFIRYIFLTHYDFKMWNFSSQFNNVQIIVFDIQTPTNSKSGHFSECVIGGRLSWNSSPAFLASPDADWSRLGSSCANGACLLCKLWKWTPFAIGRTLSTDNMLPPISLCMKCINCHDNPDGHRCDFIY